STAELERFYFGISSNSWSRLRQMSTVFFPFRDVAYLDIYNGKHFPKATLLFGP
uniref:Uncharacterized protein n=1 Tax=Ailuropoda melanoleuca TaxID=9646 RepID=A0A7N5K3T4_AILME